MRIYKTRTDFTKLQAAQNPGIFAGTVCTITDEALNPMYVFQGGVWNSTVTATTNPLTGGVEISSGEDQIYLRPKTELRTIAASLPFCPKGGALFETPLGWTGGIGTGTDANGYYVSQGNADVETIKYPCAQLKTFIVKVRFSGRMPNRCQINFYGSTGTYLANVSMFFLTSAAYTPPTDGAVVELSRTFTAPANASISQVGVIFKAEADLVTNNTKHYGVFVEDVDNLPKFPRRRVPFNFRGVAINNMVSEQTWAIHSGVTQTMVADNIAYIKTTFGLAHGDCVRIFLNSDVGFSRDDNGVPQEFTSVFWQHVQWLVDACVANGLTLIPVLFFPWPFASAYTNQFDRRAMISEPIVSGYAARATDLGRYFNSVACVPAVDLINEYGWNMTFNPNNSDTYTPRQIAACFERIAAGFRMGSKKPIICSTATGRDMIPVLAYQDEDSYDIISYHNYNSANFSFFQHLYDKPIIAGEYGPDVAEVVEATKATQTKTVQDAIPALVSAAFLYGGYGINQPTTVSAGSVKNSTIVNNFKADRSLARETGVKVAF